MIEALILCYSIGNVISVPKEALAPQKEFNRQDTQTASLQQSVPVLISLHDNMCREILYPDNRKAFSYRSPWCPYPHSALPGHESLPAYAVERSKSDSRKDIFRRGFFDDTFIEPTGTVAVTENGVRKELFNGCNQKGRCEGSSSVHQKLVLFLKRKTRWSIILRCHNHHLAIDRLNSLNGHQDQHFVARMLEYPLRNSGSAD